MFAPREIGIAQGSVEPVRQLEHLARCLDDHQAQGFRLVELNPHPFHLIIDGEVHQPSLRDWAAVLRNFDLRYTIHGLDRLNLAYDPRHELCRRVMRSQIEVCGAIGASTLVHHSGLQALDAVRYGVRRTLLTEEELAEGAEREVDAFRELAPVAADAGVMIGMENGDSHQWEHTLIAHYGLPRESIWRYHARLHIEPIARQLEAIDHPNVGLALDIGHLYIAAHDLRFDYLGSVEAAASWVNHLQVSDNCGRLDRGFEAEHDRWAFGEADIHMPPGWGNIPYREVFDHMPEYRGDVILEIKPGFLDHAAQGLETLRELLQTSQSSGSA
jgi:sugar phosphate isomerase/epimerase